MSATWRFDGRKAVVTGGSRGIGRSIAELLVASGAEVHVFDVAAGEPGAFTFHAVNIADSADVARAVADLPAGISLLVNNAGITRDKSVLKLSDEDWKAVLDVNLTGTFHMIRALAPAMREAGYGRIVNITSINGMRGKFEIGRAHV